MCMGFFDFESKIDGVPVSEYVPPTEEEKEKELYKEVINYNYCSCPNCGEKAKVTLNGKAKKLATGGGLVAMLGSFGGLFATASVLGWVLSICTLGLVTMSVGAILIFILPYLLIAYVIVYLPIKLISDRTVKHTITCDHCGKAYKVDKATLEKLIAKLNK